MFQIISAKTTPRQQKYFFDQRHNYTQLNEHMVEMTRGQVVTLEEYSKREVFRKFFASSTDAIKEDRNTVNVDT